MSFASNLKRVMTERSISQAELSALTGISKSGISQYLSGKYEPKERIVEKLADVLECSSAYLMCENDANLDTFGMKNITVEQAAKMLGKSKQFVRVALQRGIAPFGFAVKTSSKYSYHISPKKLAEYINKG